MSRLLTAALLLLAMPAVANVETEPVRGLRAEVAALLVQGVAGGELPVAVTVFPEPANATTEAGGLSFLVELPSAPPAESEEGRPLEVYAYALDPRGEVVAYSGVSLPRWPVAGEGVKVVGRLEAPGGALSLRFLAWDPIDRRYGLAVRELAAGEAPPTPRIAEECDAWAVAGDDEAGWSSFTARPVLLSGESRRLLLPGARPPAAWRVRLAGSGDDGPVTIELDATVAGRDELEIVVPDLRAGVYRLSVAAPDGAWSAPELDVWLVSALPAAEEGCYRSWGRVLRLARAGVAAPPPAEPVEPPEGKRAWRRLAAEYQELLSGLAVAGDLAGSAGRLAELEAPAVGDEPDRTRQLAAAELEPVRQVAEHDARCLLPLIALHAETYRQHHQAGRFLLATHSRRMAAAIAELAAERLEAKSERRLLSVGLANLADMVEARRASIEAQRLLERALELDDEHEAARLLLAVSYERKGRYDDARRQWELLVAANSAHHEARVRLAVLLRRMGETEQSERLLRAVLAERPPGWLLSLAYQTLAQLLIREARLGEALEAIDEGLGRRPGDQALQVLLAYARDRSGERLAVRETLSGLSLDSAGISPRYRYSDEPAEALGLLRETLRQSVTVRLPVLAQALAEAPIKGGAR